jgi:hypothetical protein
MSIFQDNAIAAYSFQSAAQLCGLFRRSERTDKSRGIYNRTTYAKEMRER